MPYDTMNTGYLQYYAYFVSSRTRYFPSEIEDRLHAAIGAAGEAGELLDAVKKAWVYGKPLDTQNIYEELGDMLFYIQAMCNVDGVSLQDIMQRNIDKLRARYPEGYSNAAAVARADKKGENHDK